MVSPADRSLTPYLITGPVQGSFSSPPFWHCISCSLLSCWLLCDHAGWVFFPECDSDLENIKGGILFILRLIILSCVIKRHHLLHCCSSSFQPLSERLGFSSCLFNTPLSKKPSLLWLASWPTMLWLVNRFHFVKKIMASLFSLYRKSWIHSLSTHHFADGGVGEVFESKKQFCNVAVNVLWYNRSSTEACQDFSVVLLCLKIQSVLTSVVLDLAATLFTPETLCSVDSHTSPTPPSA